MKPSQSSADLEASTGIETISRRDPQEGPIVTYSVQESIDLIGNGQVQYFAMVATILCMVSYTVDILGFSLVLPIATCDLSLDTFRKGLLASAPFLGLTLSAHSWGFLADYIGRRSVICLSLLSSITFSFVSALAPEFWTMVVLRFFSGLCLSGASSAMYPYIGELLTSKSRAKLMSLIGFSLGIGLMYTTGAAWLLQKYPFSIPVTESFVILPWRIQMIVALLPGIAAFVIYFCLPESPRFVSDVQGNTTRAMGILRWIHVTNGGGDKDFPVKRLWDGVQMGQKRSLSVVVHSMLHETKLLFHAPCLWPMLGACLIQYALFTISAGYLMWFPEITSRLKSGQNGSLNMCAIFSSFKNATEQDLGSSRDNEDGCGVVQIPDKVFLDNSIISLGYFLANTIIFFSQFRFPLRKIIATSMTVSCVSACLLPSLTNEWAIVISFVCFVTGSSVGISVFNVIIVEIFPNFLCGMAISLALLMGRIATFAATSSLGLLLEMYCSWTLYGTGVLLATAIVCFWALPARVNLVK